jgi:hypothetical protein
VGTRDHVVPADRINNLSFPSRGSLRLLIKRTLGPELEDLSRSKLVQLIPSFTTSPLQSDNTSPNLAATRLSNDHQGCIFRLPTPRACRTHHAGRGSIRRGAVAVAWQKKSDAATAAFTPVVQPVAALQRGVAAKHEAWRSFRTVGAGCCAAEAGGGLRPLTAMERLIAQRGHAAHSRPRTAAAGLARGAKTGDAGLPAYVPGREGGRGGGGREEGVRARAGREGGREGAMWMTEKERKFRIPSINPPPSAPPRRHRPPAAAASGVCSRAAGFGGPVRA